jgi:flagellar biosynthesis protein FlhG
MAEKSLSMRVIAFVSGKGGSGKTLVAAAFADFLSAHTVHPVYVVDADLATGGMTYYLGFKLFQRTARGFSDIVIRNLREADKQGAPIPFASTSSKGFKLMPVGNHRALMRLPEHSFNAEPEVEAAFEYIIAEAKNSSQHYPIVLVDCRGGMDNESVAICRQATDVVLIAETDATSIQASQHLVDVLSDRNASGQLRASY